MPTDISARETRGRILWLAWTSTLGSLAVYLWLRTMIDALPRPALTAQWPAETLLNLFYGAAIGLFALTIVVRTLIRRGGEAATSHSDSAAASPTGDPRRFALFMVVLALAEFIALIGLILYWLIRTPEPFLLFLATALAALMINRPPKSGVGSTEHHRSAP